ncbi:hypothetical protein OUZ56_021885 [Daphnia magna]|uniref:Uncharacterized protein n=1 Tax=Daphnia magna TaxID=35525 RepID=A0ABR0AUR4_9CRUS|nr:hypothetical protein OUZ56_021885 [Daphnia magna]
MQETPEVIEEQEEDTTLEDGFKIQELFQIEKGSEYMKGASHQKQLIIKGSTQLLSSLLPNNLNFSSFASLTRTIINCGNCRSLIYSYLRERRRKKVNVEVGAAGEANPAGYVEPAMEVEPDSDAELDGQAFLYCEALLADVHS